MWQWQTEPLHTHPLGGSSLLWKWQKDLQFVFFLIPGNKSELCSTKQAQDSHPLRTFLLLIILVSLEIYIFMNYISALNCYMMAALRPHFGISFVGKQKAHCTVLSSKCCSMKKEKEKKKSNAVFISVMQITECKAHFHSACHHRVIMRQFREICHRENPPMFASRCLRSSELYCNAHEQARMQLDPQVRPWPVSGLWLTPVSSRGGNYHIKTMKWV